MDTRLQEGIIGFLLFVVGKENHTSNFICKWGNFLMCKRVFRSALPFFLGGGGGGAWHACNCNMYMISIEFDMVLKQFNLNISQSNNFVFNGNIGDLLSDVSDQFLSNLTTKLHNLSHEYVWMSLIFIWEPRAENAKEILQRFWWSGVWIWEILRWWSTCPPPPPHPLSPYPQSRFKGDEFIYISLRQKKKTLDSVLSCVNQFDMPWCDVRYNRIMLVDTSFSCADHYFRSHEKETSKCLHCFICEDFNRCGLN